MILECHFTQTFMLYTRGLKLKLLRGPNENYKVTSGPHYDYPKAVLWPWCNNCSTWTFLKTAFTSYFLREALWVIGK